MAEPLGTAPDQLQIVDPVLTQIAVQYRPHGFVYEQLVNSFPVEYNIGQYPVFEKGGFFASSEGHAIADDASTPIVKFEYEEAFYHCKDYRKRVRITRKEYQQAHPALRLEQSSVIGLLDVFAGEREKRLAEKLKYSSEATAINGTGFTNKLEQSEAGNKWDEGTEATKGAKVTIQKDIQEAMKKVYAKTGIWPNTLLLTKQMALSVAIDFTLKDQIKYAMGLQAIEKGVDILPSTLFGLNVVIVDGALTNSAGGGATPNLEEIWGKTARVMYIDPNPAWGKPTTVYGMRGKVTDGFAYSTPAVADAGGVSQLEPGGLSQYTVVDRWTEPDPPANNIRVWECVDEHIVAPDLGCEILSNTGGGIVS